MKYDLEEIKKLLKDGEMSFVLGYGAGRNECDTIPMIFKNLEDLAKLRVNHFCNHNLATYLLDLLKESADKFAIMVKPCDEKSLVELERENQFQKDSAIIISLPCEGVIDPKKVAALKTKATESINNITIDSDKATIDFGERSQTVDLVDIVANKCLECDCVGEAPEEGFAFAPTVRPCTPCSPSMEHKSLKQTLPAGAGGKGEKKDREYWLKEYEKCIRCGACRRVCPLCYCEKCVFEDPKSKILGQAATTKNNGAFLMGRAMHLAGRCTGCGRCGEVCPVSVDHDGINKPLAQYVLDTFEFKAGDKNDKKAVFSVANAQESTDFGEDE